MLSKSQISFVKSLHQKKYRKETGLFIIEGIKSLTEFLPSDYQIESIFFLPEYRPLLPESSSNIKLFEVNNADLAKISTLQTPPGVLALLKIPAAGAANIEVCRNTFSIALDQVQDPGNLGTIIRTADWFGFKNIICSENTVEVYNPKTVQATMGSLARVHVFYTNLPAFLKKVEVPVYAAMLEGESLFKINWKKEGIVVLGNEGQGISAQVSDCVAHSITIPRIGAAESLNVSISGAIICAEISRNINK
jgi:TrmH family RNA methyltransferase